MRDCCLRELRYKKDVGGAKKHHHTDYEVHIIKRGYQNYEVDGEPIRICGGELLLIPPGVRHMARSGAEGTEKFALTFRADERVGVFYGPVPEVVLQNLEFIISEVSRYCVLSEPLIANRIFESAVIILREAGMRQEQVYAEGDVTDGRLMLARQYIEDNIDGSPTVGEIADYCHLGNKQLTRIFISELGITPLEYINRAREERIKQLLSDTELPIGEISRIMSFSSEYYFNSFFKRRVGMPPGEYRKMYCGVK